MPSNWTFTEVERLHTRLDDQIESLNDLTEKHNQVVSGIYEIERQINESHMSGDQLEVATSVRELLREFAEQAQGLHDRHSGNLEDEISGYQESFRGMDFDLSRGEKRDILQSAEMTFANMRPHGMRVDHVPDLEIETLGALGAHQSRIAISQMLQAKTATAAGLAIGKAHIVLLNKRLSGLMAKVSRMEDDARNSTLHQRVDDLFNREQENLRRLNDSTHSLRRGLDSLDERFQERGVRTINQINDVLDRVVNLEDRTGIDLSPESVADETASGRLGTIYVDAMGLGHLDERGSDQPLTDSSLSRRIARLERNLQISKAKDVAKDALIRQLRLQLTSVEQRLQHTQAETMRLSGHSLRVHANQPSLMRGQTPMGHYRTYLENRVAARAANIGPTLTYPHVPKPREARLLDGPENTSPELEEAQHVSG